MLINNNLSESIANTRNYTFKQDITQFSPVLINKFIFIVKNFIFYLKEK
jgi:hypothetical protein